MKKFLALALVAIMALGMVSMASAEAEPVKVGVCIYQFNDNFMTLYRNELQSYLETTYGAEVTIVDGKNDQAEQTNQINSFIAQGVDVLIINLVQSTAASTVIDLVEAAGIPTVFINREPSEEDMARFEGKITYVGADARQSGTYQGEIIAESANKGDFNGNGVVDYVMIMGDPENVDAQYRTEFSIKALTDAGLTVNKLFEQRGDWMQENGQQLAANALAQFGSEVDVIFCNNDAMALGAYQAIVSAGRVVNEDIYLVGVDALDECVEMVKAGTMTGTVLNDHIGQSHQAADAAMIAAAGEALEAYYWVDYQKVTAE
jgi:methyl-galactoside transport system substrate-binding protein